MAIVKEVEINVKTASALRAMDELGLSFTEAFTEADNLSGQIGELEDALYEMARAGKSGTKEFDALSAEVGKMKKVIIDTDMVVDGMSQTLAQNLGGALGGVTAAFELGAGAMGAMGVESEKVQEALLKVQSAMAIAQGVQGLREAAPAFKALGKSAIDALKGIKAAVAATGIGLLLVAVGALVAYWDDIKGAISGVSDEQERLNKAAAANVAASNENLAAFTKKEEILRL